jgi:hypothetical protein
MLSVGLSTHPTKKSRFIRPSNPLLRTTAASVKPQTADSSKRKDTRRERLWLRIFEQILVLHLLLAPLCTAALGATRSISPFAAGERPSTARLPFSNGPPPVLTDATRCRCPLADRAASTTRQSCRGPPRVTRQNGASAALRQYRVRTAFKSKPALGRAPCRPMPSRFSGSRYFTQIINISAPTPVMPNRTRKIRRKADQAFRRPKGGRRYDLVEVLQS